MKPILVGIVGPSGSGKTTLCIKLKAKNKNYEHVRLDNYFKHPRTFSSKKGFRNWEKPSNLKFEVLLKHLKALKNNKNVHTKSFPKKAGSKAELIVLKPKPVILVEGFMLLKDRRIRNILDVKIYLDVHPKLMLERRAIRFGPEYINEYDTQVAIPEFLKHGVIQKKYADYIIDATASQNQVIKQVKKVIKRAL